MKKTILAIICLSGFLLQSHLSAQEWEMKQARIMTPWSESIDPENVLPEYPRPQMVRDSWMNLNGLWDFTKVEQMVYNAEQSFDKKILVPYPMESAISGVMDTLHMQNRGKVFLYRRFFTVPTEMKDKNILLHFGAIDWHSEIYVNGIKVGAHKGGFDPFKIDITSALKTSGEQEVQVFVRDYQEFGGYPHGKQKIGEKKIWYTPVTGIWQTVWLEPVSDVHIDKLVIKPNIDNKTVNIKVATDNQSETATATIKIYDGESLVSETPNVKANTDVSIPISSLKLWSPTSPFLYDMEIELSDNGKVTDKVESYFGMRKISMGEKNGKPCMLLNNEYLFQYGVLDQGYWPDGIYTAPSDEALKFDLEKTKEFGMNLSRKHIKVEPARWYYHCDKMGLLVWQDIPNPGYGENGKIMGEDTDLRENFHREMINIIEALENYPSIVVWTIYNESWGQPDQATTKFAVDIVRNLDPDRLINAASGWNDYEHGDLKDTHWYPAPNINPNPENKRVSVCGEYGGITMFVKGHQWLGGSEMTYTTVDTPEELKNTFIEFINKVLLLQADGINAAVYTQITDVEDEENGLISYDRKVVKVNEQQIAEIKEAIDRNATMSSFAVLPASNNAENKWKYNITSSPISSTTWMTSSYSDRYWPEGKAGFGNEAPNNAPVNTKWTTPYIYLRKMVDFSNIKPEDLDKLFIYIFHDEDCEVYINGVLALKLDKYVDNYVLKGISDEAKAAIKFDEPNLVAISCHQTTGGQFIDAGFYLVGVPRNYGTGILTETINTNNRGCIYPNPAKNSFSVKDVNDNILGVNIFDLTGKSVKSFPGRNNDYNIEGLNPGIYLVKINTEKQVIAANLIVRD